MARISRALGVCACVASLAGEAAAQPAAAMVRGTVVDEAGAPVAGATILIGDQTAVTDRDGAFAVRGGGRLTVIASGYRSQTVAAAAGIVVRLVRASDEVINLTGRAPEESQPLEYTISAADVRTTPGAMNDALRAVTVLPAAARIPFSFGGLVLRGMSPRDSSVFIDGVEIPIAFHFGGITGVFPTQVLGDMKVVPSGFDVSLGRTQGGVIELASRTPRGDAYRVGGEVSLLHSAVSGEGPLPGRGAFLVALRRSYFDVLVRPFVSEEDPLPSYGDGQIRAVWGEPARRGQLAAFVLGSLDRIANSPDAARPDDPEAGEHTAVDLGFVRAGASYKRRIDKTLVTVAPVLGTNILSFVSKSYHGTDQLDEVDLSRRWYVFAGRGEWLRDDPGGFLRAGLDVSGGYLGRVSAKVLQGGDVDDDFPVPRNTVLWTDAALFVEARRHWDGERYSIRPGLRLDRFGLGNQWALDPRVNGHVSLSEITRMRASLGRFHQPPSPAHFDEFTDNLDAQSSYVDQATLGVEWTPARELSASLTAFGHRGRRTLVDVMEDPREGLLDLELIFRELLEDQLGFYGHQRNVGRQLSYGLEVALRHDADAFRVMANYAWSRARRYDPALGRGWEPYGLDQPMRLNLLFATTAYRWNVGSRLTIVSGNPVHVVPEGTPFVPEAEEPPEVLLRLPTFWQLDIRIDRMWRRPWGAVSLFFDIQNVTNHRNVEFRESNPHLIDPANPSPPLVYRYDDVRGLPILPYIGVEIVPR